MSLRYLEYYSHCCEEDKLDGWSEAVVDVGLCLLDSLIVFSTYYSTVMGCITTFRSMTNQIYDGGLIRL